MFHTKVIVEVQEGNLTESEGRVLDILIETLVFEEWGKSFIDLDFIRSEVGLTYENALEVMKGLKDKGYIMILSWGGNGALHHLNTYHCRLKAWRLHEQWNEEEHAKDFAKGTILHDIGLSND